MEITTMMTQTIAYKPFGIGEWTHARVSKDVAQALVKEYSSYGWPTMLDNEVIETATEKKAA